MAAVLHTYDIGPEVTAFSTTRHGGCSEGDYGTVNINAFCNDSPGHIAANRRMLAHQLGVEEPLLLMAHQVHQTRCKLIDQEILRLTREECTARLEGYDCLLTREKGVCIGVSTADCVPILLYDPAHHAAAAVHAGWRGTVDRIVETAIEAMNQCFDTHTADLRAVIGPSISLRNFEVGQEVYDAFAAAGHDMEQIAVRMDKWHIDLWACNHLQLEHMGVQQAHIQVAGICTYDAVDDYFSARRLGINSGRIYNGMILR